MRFFVLLYIMCYGLIIHAQEFKTVRLEIPADMDADSYHVEPMGENGVLIFYASNEVNELGKRNWYFGLFDEKLDQEWLKFVSINEPIEYKGARLNGKRIHLLFRNSGKMKGSAYDFYELVTYDAANQSFSQISGTLPEKCEIVGFEVIDNTACLALNLNKFATDLLFVSLISGDVFPEHLSPDSESMIMKLDVDRASRHFIVAQKIVSDGRYVKDKILLYNPSRKLIREYQIESSDGIRMLRDFEFFPNYPEHLVVVGSYDIVAGRMASLKDVRDIETARSAGFYFLKFENTTQTTINYFDFLNFTQLQGAEKQPEVINARTVVDSTGAKEKQRVLTSFFHLTEAVALSMNGEYIVSAEIFSPQYRTETRMDYDYYGRPYPYTYRVFAGYKYEDAILAAFSSDGNMLWDNELVMSDLVSFKLKNHTCIIADSPYITLGYANKGKLYSQAYKDGKQITEDEINVAGLFTRDKVIEDEDNSLVHWYDNFFLIYGDQVIRNRTMSDKEDRVVFYVNKVAFQ